MEILRKLPIKVRQMSVKSNETPYTYMVTSDTRFGNFMRDYKNALKRRAQQDEQLQVDQPEALPDVENEPAVAPEQEKATDLDVNKEQPQKEAKAEDTENKEKGKDEAKAKDTEKDKNKEKKQQQPAQQEKPSEGEVIEVQ